MSKLYRFVGYRINKYRTIQLNTVDFFYIFLNVKKIKMMNSIWQEKFMIQAEMTKLVRTVGDQSEQIPKE